MGRKKKKLRELQPQPQKHFDKDKVSEFLKSYSLLIDFIVINDKFNPILEYLLTTEINGEKIIDVQNKPVLLFHAAYFKAPENFNTLVNTGKIEILSLDENKKNVLHYALSEVKIPQFDSNNTAFLFNKEVNEFKKIKLIKSIINLTKRDLIKAFHDPRIYNFLANIEKNNITQAKEGLPTLGDKELIDKQTKRLNYLLFNIRTYLTINEEDIESAQIIHANAIQEKDCGLNKALERLNRKNQIHKLIDSELENAKSKIITIIKAYNAAKSGNIELCNQHITVIKELLTITKTDKVSNENKYKQSKKNKYIFTVKGNYIEDESVLQKILNILNQVSINCSGYDEISDNNIYKLSELSEIYEEHNSNNPNLKVLSNIKNYKQSSIFLLQFPDILKFIKDNDTENLLKIVEVIKKELKLYSTQDFDDPKINIHKPLHLLSILNSLNEIFLPHNSNIENSLLKYLETFRILLEKKIEHFSNYYYNIHKSIFEKNFNLLATKLKISNRTLISDRTLETYQKFLKAPKSIQPEKENILFKIIFVKLYALQHIKPEDIQPEDTQLGDIEFKEFFTKSENLYKAYSIFPEVLLVIKCYEYYIADISNLTHKQNEYLETLNNYSTEVNNYGRLTRLFYKTIKAIINLNSYDSKFEKQNPEYKELKANTKDEDLSELDEEKEVEIGLGINFNTIDLNYENDQAKNKSKAVDYTEPESIYPHPSDLDKFIKIYKKQLASQIQKSFQASGWCYKGKNYCTSDGNISQISPNFYLYFDKNELKDQYENVESSLKSASNALLHGKAKSAKGASGVKFRKDKALIAIKVPSKDDRICARKVLENSEGTKLILFDEILTHKEIDKLPLLYTNKNWLDSITIPVEDYKKPEELYPLLGTQPNHEFEWDERLKEVKNHRAECAPDCKHLPQEILALIGKNEEAQD